MSSTKTLLSFATTVLMAVNFVGIGQMKSAAQTSAPPVHPPHVTTGLARQREPESNQVAANIAVNQIPEAGICPNELADEIDRIIEQPIYNTAQWGIKIELLSPNTNLYSRNADGFLIPASNVKLLTTAAALQMLPYGDEQALAEIEEEIQTINRKSDNDYADDLLDRIGGASIVQKNLSSLGIDPHSYRQVDGSGLSRKNYTTAATLVQLLKAMRFAQESNRFYASLPVSGVSGTLQKRFVNTSVQGRLIAKTGTLKGVRALSGYLEHPTYGMIVFSILVNQENQGDSLRKAIDQIVVTVGQLKHC